MADRHRIVLSTRASSSTPARAQDIILVDKQTRKNTRLGVIPAELSIDFEELSRVIDNGAETGIGIYRASGDVILYQNNVESAANVQLHEGTLYDMHVLFTSGEAMSTEIYTNDRVLERYRNILSFKDFFGIGFKVKDSSGGADRAIHLILSGTVALRKHYRTTAREFYAKFPESAEREFGV
jgi:hypothetical protein